MKPYVSLWVGFGVLVDFADSLEATALLMQTHH
jgi:hypothetical protein